MFDPQLSRTLLRQVPYKAAILFSIFSLLWIFFSDRLISKLYTDPNQLITISSLKGLFYVVVTASLLFLTSRWAIQRVVRREEALGLERELERQRLTLVVDRMQVLAIMLDERLEPVRMVGPRPPWVTVPLRKILAHVKTCPAPGAGWQGFVVENDGEQRRLEFSLTLVEKGLNDPACYLCLLRDVTALHLLKEEQRQSHTHLQAIVDASPMGVTVVDPEGCIQFWSKSSERLLRYKAEEAIGRRLQEFQHPGADRQYEAQRLWIRDTALVGEPLDLVRQDGGHFTARIWTAPLAAPSGLEGYVVLMEDLTEARQIQDALKQYRLLVDHSEEICLFVGEQGKIIDANPAATRFYGYSLEELRRQSIFDLRTDPPALVEAQLDAARNTNLWFEAVHRRRDGQEVAVEVTAFAAERQGQRISIRMIRDITPRKRQQAYRELVHRLNQAVMQGASVEPIMAVASHQRSPWLTEDSADTETLELVDHQIESALSQAAHQRRLNMLEAALRATANGVVITDSAGRMEWVNPAFTTMTGYSAEEAIDQTPRLFSSGGQTKAFYARLWRTILSGRVWQGEVRNRRKDGTLYEEEMTVTPVRDQTGQITHFIAIKNDVTQRKERDEQIHRLSTTDTTTGLMNRSRLVTLLANLDRRSEDAALVVLVIDQLQFVNRSLGFDAGDLLLIHAANVIAQVAAKHGFAARICEDEFAMVIWGPVSAGQEIADRVRHEIMADPPTHSGTRIEISLSAGVAPLASSTPVTEAQLQAEQALTEAKRLGGNRCVVYTPDMMESDNLVTWSNTLRHALRNDGFELHYQPVIRLADRRASHVEALIRMRDANGAILSPAAFLPMADRLHLMSHIDQWVSSTVIMKLREFPSLQAFVNLSGQSLNDMELLTEILTRLKREPRIAKRIMFEITESTAIRNVDATRAWMSSMQSIGVHFALDDFGTGFSSFAYLRDLPVEYVKLDGSFVRGIESNPTNQAVVRSVVDVAHSLGKSVIAEWVENDQEANLLAEMGVEYGQGFGLAKPSPDLSWVLSVSAGGA